MKNDFPGKFKKFKIKFLNLKKINLRFFSPIDFDRV